MRTRSSKGGGILIALKDNLDINLTIININEAHEQMTVQISNKIWKIKMCVVYGLPAGEINYRI